MCGSQTIQNPRLRSARLRYSLPKCHTLQTEDQSGLAISVVFYSSLPIGRWRNSRWRRFMKTTESPCHGTLTYTNALHNTFQHYKSDSRLSISLHLTDTLSHSSIPSARSFSLIRRLIRLSDLPRFHVASDFQTSLQLTNPVLQGYLHSTTTTHCASYLGFPPA